MTKDQRMGIAMVALLGIAALITACQPSDKAKAILADQEIRKEVCDSLLPDGKQFFTYSKADTQPTKDEIIMINRWVDSYCH